MDKTVWLEALCIYNDSSRWIFLLKNFRHARRMRVLGGQIEICLNCWSSKMIHVLEICEMLTTKYRSGRLYLAQIFLAVGGQYKEILFQWRKAPLYALVGLTYVHWVSTVLLELAH